MPFIAVGTDGSQASYTTRREHAGWDGILHGGVTFALMDEAFGWSRYYQNLPVVTARVETRFHKPVAVGTKLTVKAWVMRQRRRLFEAHAEIRMDSPEATLVAEADATMCLIRKNTKAEALLFNQEVLKNVSI